MARGPVEVVVVAFTGTSFSGDILPELRRLVDSEVIAIVDGVLAIRDGDGAVTVHELEDIGADHEAHGVATLVGEVDDLLSEEDIDELAASLAPDTSAAILVFEHRWARSLRRAVLDAGGEVAATIRIPAEVVEQVEAGLATT